MRLALRTVLLGTVLFGTVIPLSPHAGAATEHCADHTIEVKVESDDRPATVEVIDTNTGDPVTVVVTITRSDFVIESADPSVELTNASWCIKSNTNTNSGTGMTGSSTSTNKKGVVQDISYVVIYSVMAGPPPQPCNSTTQSGGQGITETVHQLGVSGPTSFLFEWEAWSFPDQFEVFYEGALIFDTGLVGDDINEGTGSATINVPAGSATTVTVRVTGPQANTLWSYTVNCPAA